jgi:transcriptional regulator with XRE-family HTH domain
MPRRTVVADPAFGRRLKELRGQRGISLRRLGQLVHCSHGFLWDLEAGTKLPSVSVATLLDGALGADGQLAALVHDMSANIDHQPVARSIAVGAHVKRSRVLAGLAARDRCRS